MLVNVHFNGINMLLLDKHITLFNNCGTYTTARHLKKHGFALQYALACLSQSKYKLKLA